MQGKQIDFVEDWGNGRHPVPFILPPQTLWAWLKTKYLQNTASFIAYYNNEANRDKLWVTGAQDNELTEMPLPRLLTLPTFVTEFLGKQGGSCLPHKLQKFVKDYIDGGESHILPKKWQLILNWCLPVLQEKDGTSLLNIRALEPALC